MTRRTTPEASEVPSPGRVGFGKTIGTGIRLTVGMCFLISISAPVLLMLLVLLPWRRGRIGLTNHVGTVVGWTLMRIAGCTVTVEGREHFNGSQPAICIGNHTSSTDAFTSIWLTPPSTVGVAKKEILRYPVYGQIWYLSGHLVIDRSNTETAKQSFRDLAVFVRKLKLSVLLWPEGTRSRDGRLQPFKKGFVHLALETGLPIVPMVITGAHDVWIKGKLRLHKKAIHIQFLPPIDTSSWTRETVNEHALEVWEQVRDALPACQRPEPSP